MSTAPRHLDHIVVAAPDLDDAVGRIETATGVRLEQGGVHPRFGTKNYLATFGDGTYFELIGADPENTEFSGERAFRVNEVTEPRAVAWAIEPESIEAATAAARQAGTDLGAPFPGSRRNPDGTLLQWRLTPPLAEPSGVIPFLLDWDGSTSPAFTVQPRLSLVHLQATHPDPDYARAVLAALGTDLAVGEGPERLIVTIEGPTGRLAL